MCGLASSKGHARCSAPSFSCSAGCQARGRMPDAYKASPAPRFTRSSHPSSTMFKATLLLGLIACTLGLAAGERGGLRAGPG